MANGVSLAQNFSLEICCNCGIAFALPLAMLERLKQTHDWFYCPSGHAQHYTAETEAETLKKRLAAEETRRVAAQQALAAQIEKLKQVEARVNAGVCPHCHRTFKNVQRHMQTKHEKCIAAVPEVKRLMA